jgi:hypothetical protein
MQFIPLAVAVAVVLVQITLILPRLVAQVERQVVSQDTLAQVALVALVALVLQVQAHLPLVKQVLVTPLVVVVVVVHLTHPPLTVYRGMVQSVLAVLALKAILQYTHKHVGFAR